MKNVSVCKLQLIIIVATCCMLICSCTQIDVFEKNTVIPKYEWQSNFSAAGDFLVTDTVSAYSIYVVLRHTDAYQYNNIWLNIGLQPPSDSMHNQRLNLQLGDDANGWEGTGMNDIWEVRKLLNDKPAWFKHGKYSFTVSQVMRDNPLLHIMSAGLRIEKKKD